MSKRFCVMFKVCMFFAVFAFAAAQLPAAEWPAAGGIRDRKTEELRPYFVENMFRGVVKGMELVGKPVSLEQQKKIRAIISDTFPKVIARIEQAGLYDEYREQIKDPEIIRLDDEAMKARTMQEVLEINRRAMKITSSKRPRLFNFLNSDQKLNAITRQMFQEIMAVLK